jgi:abortive infection bacteriophage resistance protein
VPHLDHLLRDQQHTVRPYGTVAIVQFLIRQISPESAWANRLQILINGLPVGLSQQSMGVPDDWQELALWRPLGSPASYTGSCCVMQ